jgi:hypothetical protein
VGFPTSNGGSTQPPTHGRASFELIGPGLQGITYGPLPLHLLLRTGSAWANMSPDAEWRFIMQVVGISTTKVALWHDIMPMLGPVR